MTLKHWLNDLLLSVSVSLRLFFTCLLKSLHKWTDELPPYQAPVQKQNLPWSQNFDVSVTKRRLYVLFYWTK